MNASPVSLLARGLPVLLLCVGAAFWFAEVQPDTRWLWRNTVPLAIVVLLTAFTLWRGGGRFTGSGWRLPLGTLGFAVPALGLACYLHYAYAVNLDDLFAAGPGELFRWLPVYTCGAGAIGFAIGWIVGRGV